MSLERGSGKVDCLMKPYERRIWLTALLMVVCYCGTLWTRSGYSFEVVPLSRELKTVPLEINGWHGQDIPSDERVAAMLNAQDGINRVYRNPEGVNVALNISAWLLPETVSNVAPHVPKLCYVNAGWKVLAERESILSTPKGDFTMTNLFLEKQGDQICVAYWYQMGAQRFTSPQESRAIHRSLWGKRKWPATLKVLIQTSAGSIDAGLPLIERFALLVEEQLSAIDESIRPRE